MMKILITKKQYNFLLKESVTTPEEMNKILATLGFLYQHGSSMMKNLPEGYSKIDFMKYKKELYLHLQKIKNGETPSPLSGYAKKLYTIVTNTMGDILKDENKMKPYIKLGQEFTLS